MGASYADRARVLRATNSTKCLDNVIGLVDTTHINNATGKNKMLILIMMVVAVVGPLVALIVTEAMDAKWDRQYNEVMEQRYAARKAREARKGGVAL